MAIHPQVLNIVSVSLISLFTQCQRDNQGHDAHQCTTANQVDPSGKGLIYTVADSETENCV